MSGLHDLFADPIHVFQIDDGERHWYCARDEDDAWALFDEPGNGMNMDHITRDDVEIVRVDERSAITVHGDDTGRLSFTAREWCALNGRGFLASTVY